MTMAFLPTPAAPADLDPARVGAGSLAAVAAELIGPFFAAATPEPLAWTTGPGAPRADVPSTTRHPLVLVTLLGDLGGPEEGTLQVTVTLGSIGPGSGAQPPVHFAAYTPAGSAVAVATPATDADGVTGPFDLQVQVRRLAQDGTSKALTPSQVRAAVRLDLVQGQLGRVLVAMVAEKVRLRRQARELTAMRTIATAERNALDRIGADLGCPRFADELVWDPVRQNPGTQPLSAGAEEPDAAYRARLAVLRGTRMANPLWIDSMLNGAGGPADPNAGWLGDVGASARVTVDETPNPLVVALRLVAPNSPHSRPQLLQAIRTNHLVWPADSPPGDAAHATRMLSPVIASRVEATRAALRDWQLPAQQPVAPALALALLRLRERCTALGAFPWPRVLAGQTDDGGSRRELGLGALLAAPDSTQLDAAVAAARAGGDPSLQPLSRAEDPAGAWLLRASGMRAAELLADGTVFVSTLAMGPLVLDVAPTPDARAPLTFTASLQSATDASRDAPLTAVVTAVAAEGLTPEASLAALLAGIVPTASAGELATVVGVLGLPAVTDVADVQSRLTRLTERDWFVVDLGTARTADVVADPGRLSALLGVAARAGASSALPLVTGTGTLALAIGVVGLPLAGTNLAGRHTVAYRWQVRGLAGDPATLSPRRGASVQLVLPGDGISVVSCVAYVRTGANDPYEWRPGLPTGTLLSLRQYEHLMNVVELVTPLGVRADTWAIRRRHVDVDGSGTPTPLPPAAARTYRRYRPHRPY
jgi:hypothetical protein